MCAFCPHGFFNGPRLGVNLEHVCVCEVSEREIPPNNLPSASGCLFGTDRHPTLFFPMEATSPNFALECRFENGEFELSGGLLLLCGGMGTWIPFFPARCPIPVSSGSS